MPVVTRLYLFVLVFSLGCATEYEVAREGGTLSEPSARTSAGGVTSDLTLASGQLGSACAPGCVWSSFAVELGAQPAGSDCGGTPCACVVKGNVYDSCADSAPAGHSAQDTSVIKRAGTACDVGCVWSSYAVAIGAQSPSEQCDLGACACVQSSDVWSACSSGYESEPTWEPAAEPAPDPEPVPVSRPRPSSRMPYFCQYENQIAGYATCQNTSIAMILAQNGWTGVPDDITREFGRHLAQSPAGLSSVFNTLAARAGIPARSTPVQNGTLAGLRAELTAGRPVIIHGYFTDGHVLVATGYDEHCYYVNDPAGRWNQRFMGGYPSGCAGDGGRGACYDHGAFEAAVATADGYSPLPLWYHQIR